MYGYFTFDLQLSSRPEQVLCIFCATSMPDVTAITVVIRRHCELNVSPDRIVLLGLESERAQLEDISTSPLLLDRLPQHTRNFDNPPVRVGLIPGDGIAMESEIAGCRWSEVQTAGMATIFRTRRALLVAPETHHFRKPSTRHSDRFIRAANALVDGAEIAFVATCCLRFIPAGIRHYYCDTGGISVLPFAIDSIRRRFDPQCVAGTVNTFESYKGLKTFEFRETESSVVLISASTSCGLEDEVCQREKRIRPSQVVTLFSVGKRERFSNVILDFEQDPALRRTLDPWKSYRDGDCPLCTSGSIAVPMLSDQFIPIRSETRTVLLLKDNAPNWLHRALQMFAGKECLRAFYRSKNTFHATNEIFIDLERMIADPEHCALFNERLDRIVAQNVPLATRSIVHLDDDASRILAERIANQLRDQRREGQPLDVLSASSAAGKSPNPDGTSLVVAAAVASGQSLLAVSQMLRAIQPNGSIAYLIGMTRMPTAAHVERLERDIRMGELASDYGFSVCERVHLPLSGANAICVWDRELELLLDWANTAIGETKEILDERIQSLQFAQSAGSRGVATNLFWGASTRQPLALRRGYVFLPPSVNADCMSQGDVFFSVSAVLHHLRNNGASPPLRQSEYERRVLSPLCFDRFNDGVIQASLLRAAIAPELNFADAPELSRQMSAILRTVFASASTPKGEAAREFLLAICLRRLVVSNDDLAKLHEEFQDCDDILSVFMWRFINSDVLNAA